MKKFCLVTFFRSLLFNLCFFSWTLLLSIVAIPFLILPPKMLVVVVGRTWAVVTLQLLRFICGITMEIRGREYLPGTPCIIVSKHQSAWETLAFYLAVKDPCFVLKKELLHIPLYGMYLKAMQSIVVDRMAGAKALKGMVHDVRDRLEEGRSVIIFPEGTRIPVGEVREYQPGVSALYARCNVPVIPVALNSGMFWGRNAFIKKPGTVVMQFLPPITLGLRRDQFMESLRRAIETQTVLLQKEAEDSRVACT